MPSIATAVETDHNFTWVSASALFLIAISTLLQRVCVVAPEG